MKYDNTRHMWTKLTILSLLFIAGTVLFPMLAQESCYEQYLREHNMTILTAEDADDSYDELKKTVLAKQMYGDSYLLMVDTVAQRTMITKVDGTYVADVHVALVDSTWYMWLSVDPLVDKYPGLTPYLYCNGNPVMLIDPDGEENQPFFSKNEAVVNLSEKSLAMNFPENDPRLNIFCHGLPGYLQMWVGDKLYEIGSKGAGGVESLKTFGVLLSERGSSLWNDKEETLEVVLHACYGAEVAKELSTQYPGVVFVGATQENHAIKGVHSGVYTDIMMPIGENEVEEFRLSGEWQYYIDGELKRISTEDAPPIYYAD